MSRIGKILRILDDGSVPAAHRPLMDAMRARWVVGDAGSARTQLAELAATYGVDEVMVHPVAGAYADSIPIVVLTGQVATKSFGR